MMRKILALSKSLHKLYSEYVYPNVCKFGYQGENARFNIPATIVGAENIFIEDNVSIGAGSIVTAPLTKITIKRNSYSGPRLFISTGNHYLKKGAFSRLLTDEDKRKDGLGGVLNWDVTIEEDVWMGANVSILCKKVGRGAVIACGAVCKKDVPPYSIVGGVPAKVIKFRFTIDEILEHEEKLYSPEERLTKNELEVIFNQFENED